MKSKLNLYCLLGVAMLTMSPVFAQDVATGAARPSPGGPQQPVPAIPPTGTADVILGRPSDSSIVLSLLRYDRDGGASIVHGLRDDPVLQTTPVVLKKDQPQEITLDKLQPNKRYSYQLKDAASGKVLASGGFQTGRARSDSFVFTLTADSHLDGNTDVALYQRTLANSKGDAPDFHIDMGDTFMTGKHESPENAALQYRAQRIFFGQAGPSMPLYLVLGNHDGEESRLLRDGANSLAVWSNMMRKRYFPNPVPDAFYSGNAKPDPWAGLLQDYYAWTWGDALFLVLDPYWHGSGRRSEAPWELTLGSTQYQWLRRTLETSQAKFKFVFVHQLVGGLGRQGRGGIEAAGFGEWGGRNADRTDGFTANRPGWEMPIHPLLLRHGVKAVFHGHDHLYAQQTLDGIVYQAMPQPGFPGEGMPRFAEEYGYRAGTILGGAGHLRVTVRPDQSLVEFVRASLTDSRNGQVAHRYIIR